MREKLERELLRAFLETEIEMLDVVMAEITAGRTEMALRRLGNRVLQLRKDHGEILRDLRRAS